MMKIHLDLVIEAVQEYFEGMYYADESRLMRAFHPGARLFGHWNGPLLDSDRDSWIKGMVAAPSPAVAGEAFDMHIVSIDMTGDKVAYVKARDAYQGLYYTDYLTLAELDGQWVIVSKVFHRDA